MFTFNHFIWLGICAVVILGLTFFSLKFKFSFKTSALVMAGVSLASEISKILSHMVDIDGGGMVLEATALPLHLCSLLIFAFFYLPFSKNEKLKNFLVSLAVPVGIIGATLALVMATSGVKFNKPEPYQCFIYHAVMIWFAIYLIATKQVKLGKKEWITNIIVLFSMSIIMIWVNSALQVYETNFWYVVKPPVENLPILNLNNGWFAYFGTLLLIGFIGLTLVHLPFIIKEYKVKKNK